MEDAGCFADERAVIQRAAAGDDAAFCQLVYTYEHRLLTFLTHMLGDAEAARDVAQETFLAAFRALPRWQPPEHAESSRASAQGLLSPWLYRIATNRAISLIRVRRLHPTPRDEVRPVRDVIEPHTISPEEQLAARDLLSAALGQLSEPDAACLVLHFVEGERYAEIGQRLGLTPEAVRKRVSRALIVLRAAYAALDVEVLA